MIRDFPLLQRLAHPELGMGVRLGMSGSDGFSPASLFAGGAPGVFYDFSDASTLFADSGGTTAASIDGAIGLVLDKSRGLAPGPELLSTGVPALAGSATAATYNTTTGVGACTRVDAGNQSSVLFAGLTATAFYKFTITNTGAVSLALRLGTGGGSLLNVPAGQTATGYLTGTTSTNLCVTAASGTGTFIVVTAKLIAGSPAYQATAASRPLWKTSGGKLFALGDGSNDFLRTNAIDFSSTDKVSVFAGVRKLSDAAAAMVAELSASVAANAGSFNLQSPSSAAANYGFASRGSVDPGAAAATTFTAPITNVLMGSGDIGGDLATLFVNGAQVAQVTGDQGSGNYGSAFPLYLFSRAGTSLFANLQLYCLIIIGRPCTPTEIGSIVSWINGRTGAF